MYYIVLKEQKLFLFFLFTARKSCKSLYIAVLANIHIPNIPLFFFFFYIIYKPKSKNVCFNVLQLFLYINNIINTASDDCGGTGRGGFDESSSSPSSYLHP